MKIFILEYLFLGAFCPVLPGPEAASPQIEQKTTAIWQKYTAISNLSKIPLLFRYFLSFLCINLTSGSNLSLIV
jgi:hypothetical protein